MNTRAYRSILLCALAAGTVLLAAASHVEYAAKVVGISDGDTITVLRDGNIQVKIRVQGIDCPESHQAFGTQAKKFTSDQCFGQIVRIEALDTDRYGRTIANVYLPSGKMLNREIVRAGFGWWYEKYAPHDDELMRLQNEARTARRGLWTEANPIPPWDYRLAERPSSSR